MQSVTVEGYLAADPRVIAAQADGRKRATFRVGETTRFRKADGTDGERTTWFNAVCFNEGTSENYIGAYARKGSRVVIHGHVEADRWTGRDGVVHDDQTLVVGEIRISNRREVAAEAPADPPPPARTRGRRTKPGVDRQVGRPLPPDLDDQIPF